MEVKGSFEVAAPIERVWDSFWVAEILPAWIPGCKRAAWEGSERITGELQQSVAQLKADFTFDLRVVELSAPRTIRLRGTGEGVTINSGVELEMAVELSAIDDATTRIEYATDARISGRLAKVGEFVLKLKAKEVQKLLARNVKTALEG